MTAPLDGQSAVPPAGQSAGVVDQGTGTAADASGQSAAGTTGIAPATGEQSVVPREEFERLRAQLAAADQKRAAAEAAHAQLRDKDVPALQKAERDLQLANQALAERDAAISRMQVELAFFNDNTRDWHAPAAAIQLLDRSKITVDAEGKVMGMKDALEALAKSHPFLLKPAPPADGTGTGGAPAAPPAPGTAPANGGITPQQGGKQSPAQMAQRFPAMRQRL